MTTHQEMRWSYPPHASVVAQSRQHLSSELRLWGITGDAFDDTVLVANELVTNAVEHARTQLHLTARRCGPTVTIAVRDEDSTLPVLRPHDILAPRGRGLQITAALTTRWGYTRHSLGKTVWAHLHI